jgi:hypothetical protein
LLLMGAPLAFLLAAALIPASPSAATGESCDERGTRELVTRFISAFNRGDVKTLDRLFARGTGWQWYAVGTAPGKRIQAAAYNRGTLVKYFRARHRQRERLVLVSFQYNGWSSGYAHFEYQLLRRAADMRKPVPRTYAGRGAVSCWAGRLAIWSMSEDS